MRSLIYVLAILFLIGVNGLFVLLIIVDHFYKLPATGSVSQMKDWLLYFNSFFILVICLRNDKSF